VTLARTRGRSLDPHEAKEIAAKVLAVSIVLERT
jgi:hypothetical protein